MWFKLQHLSIAGLPQCVCTHPINPMDIHFLCCAHGNECMGTHDAVCDTFVAITWNVGFHICGTKTTTCVSFNHSHSYHRQVDIVFTKDGICTLTNVVIIDSMCANPLLQSCTTQGFATSINATQDKERSYHNRHPTNQFFLLAIEVFRCLHK
jgi:hypothetical protein